MSGKHRGPGAGVMPVEKVKDFKGTLKRLVKYIAPYKIQLIIVLITAILSTVFSILSPKILGYATQKLFEGIMMKFRKVPGAAIDFQYIGRIVLILIALYIISSAFSYIQQYVMAGVSQKTVYNMRKDLENKLGRMPLKYFDSKPHGETLSRFTNDMDNISTTLQQSLTQLITSIITIIGIIVMMLTISPLMTIIALIVLPVSILLIRPILKKSQKYFTNQQKYLGNLNGHIEEMYTGHNIVKAFKHEEKSIKEFKDINEKLYSAGWKAQFVSGLIMPLMSFINNVGYVAVCVTGGYLATKRIINVGEIQAFIQYMRRFSQPINQTANIANIIQSTVASAERVFEILDEEEEIPDSKEGKIIENPKGEVKFQHVNFSYKKETTLIEDMNIDVKQGETIAIVGPTGAGKTTIVNLLMRFYEINEGKITIDGVDIKELKRENLRNIFGMVLQDTWSFNGTIRENIAYGREGATEEEIIQAAKTAHADHFIRTLPDGYDTVLNEEASNISQGQKQLLTIARAILADPAILILDEATSSIDTRTEVYIQKAMNNLMKGRTSFVIAHRLSTIRDADLILVMNAGKVIEQGNHQELLEKGGFYSELYNSQFTGKSLEKQVG
ncbi:ATP-binding cassette subfamily B protein [Clostridium tetanomorphum]|uniref:ABC transporter ATP-binding protein n=1 Tax=Clostridium tetanomorphum TaxID=1553 RepID=UPI00044AC76F|nr:ABC transporter ATP-binding protein [Clostridium tetanomorphum]KAJ51117.1 multidrug ABC transporter ATPase [Clostridium tetanomorphum DSM 665]MBP1864455.1 ATP-binding cassette subfamily B protein [Clostridium tetanomorphum]NRS83014.1 ATP-binding cassette subfamily B protein [Clostridium tetanomorphum]SQC01052.1 multidrug ABC transporter ATPase [Clostridium tetanomorphum]